MTTSLSGALVRGAMWSIALRWGMRVIGMVSTFVVARLVTPGDYGVVVMATLVMGLVEAFLDADATTALLRSPRTDAAYANTAWTLRLLQSCVLATVTAISAPFAARYFEQPQLTAVLLAYCIAIVGTGFGSVGPLLARRDLDFSMEVKVAFFGRVVTLVATIALAYVWRDYWALVVGTIVGMFATLVAGYVMHPYRPRFTLACASEIFGFSQWMLLSGVGLFLARKLDGFVVGRVGTAADLGVYNLALELGQMVTMELGAPLNRALLPVLSTLHHDLPRMRSALMKTVAAINTLTLPAGVGLAMVAPLAVAVLLGPNWTAAAPFLAVFSLIGTVRFVTGPYYTLLLTLGHSRLLASMAWIEFAAFALALLFVFSDGIRGIAEARVLSTLLIAGVWLFVGARYGLGVAMLGRAIARPLAGSALMAALLWSLPSTGMPDLVELLYRVAVGALGYIAFIWISWLASGRPDGIERLALEKMGTLFRRKAIPPRSG